MVSQGYILSKTKCLVIKYDLVSSVSTVGDYMSPCRCVDWDFVIASDAHANCWRLHMNVGACA